MSKIILVFCDRSVNQGRPHIQFLLACFRLAQIGRASVSPAARFLVGAPASAFYRSIGLFLFGIDIPVSTRVGTRLSIHHGVGLVVHNQAKIGSDVTLRQATTIGSKRGRGAPIIADGVDIGPNVCIIGDIVIGRGSVIGAGSVVVADVSDGCVVAGNPARLLRRPE
ncbi:MULTISPECIES: serine O-acetyltransferase [Rhodococcus]|uniref:serine O-acetyltransferase n=1 Tax=Rhodococcus TaxID=1827 RepID=UPI0015CA54A9|nr:MULTISPECIES: serine acetyltransferase [Rhodococcus]QSE83054.1 serine acetyltransferase [Rhodococcus koreensis]